MRKNTLKKAFALLVILAMLLPCLPVVAFATTSPKAIVVDDETVAAWLNSAVNDVYTIDNVTELACFMACGRGTAPTAFSGKTVKLTTDIIWNKGDQINGFSPRDGASEVYLWEPYALNGASSSDFKGTFDGDGHKISGLYITDSQYAGFIGRIRNGSIKNLIIENSYISVSASTTCDSVGMAVAAVYGTTTVTDIHVNNCHIDVAATANAIGGVVGRGAYNSAILTLKDCVVDRNSTIKGPDKIGGIYGSGYTSTKTDGSGNVLDRCFCYAKSITATNSEAEHVAGIIGVGRAANDNVSDCAAFTTKIVGETKTTHNIYNPRGSSFNTAREFSLSSPNDGVMSMEIEGVQTKINADDNSKFDARFVASILLGNVPTQKTLVGFEFSQLSEYTAATPVIQSKDCASVYTSIKTNFGGNDLTADDFDADYLGTLVITGIPKSGTKVILIRSWYQVDGGEKQYGNYALITFVDGSVKNATYVTEHTPVEPNPVKEASQALASPYNTDTYDLASLLPEDATAISIEPTNGQTVNGTTVSLNVGENHFEVTYTENGTEKSKTIAIARRAGHRVVFNSNGGSYIETKYVEDGAKISYDASVTPTRNGYTFQGWYDADGNKVTLGTTAITADTVFTARWKAPTQYDAPNTTPLTYSSSSAALNIVWKDYDNAFGNRPSQVLCTLKNTSTGESYTVKVTKNDASFEGSEPLGATISQGAGNWTVKITGLEATYSFLQNDLGTSNYTTVQSGTSVVNTLKDYSPIHDDTSILMTENGRFYDYAGNVIVLKGVVTVNVGMVNFLNNTSVDSLKRLQAEGVNCIRVTMQLNAEETDTGYLTKQNSTEKQTDARRAELMADLKSAIDTASSIGMYCIVDWGVLMLTKNNAADARAFFDSIQTDTVEFFSHLASSYINNPYVIFEICNEPNVEHGAWGSTVKPFEEAVIRAIRETGSKAVIIAAPNALARYLSDYTSSATSAEAGDDPIDNPFDTDISYNLAYTFHCYAYTLSYNLNPNNNEQYNYGWRLSEAIRAGLTVVTTEFSPATASIKAQSTGGQQADLTEANKYLNTMLENDVSYMLFRYISDFATKDTSSQHMFVVGKNEYLKNGKWTKDMMTECGKWFYDNALASNGFIKNADFNYQKPANQS